METDADDGELPLDSDLSAVRKLFGSSDRAEKQPFRKMLPPSNPSEPRQIRSIDQLQQLMPELTANSSTAEEFSENLRRVLTALFKAEFRDDPAGEELAKIEETIKLYSDFYRAQQHPDMQQRMNRREELNNFQREWQEQNR